MSEVDWLGIPLSEFGSKTVRQDDGTFKSVMYPYGDGQAQYFMWSMGDDIERRYEAILPQEGIDRWEETGEVPVLRDGEWGYEKSDAFTLRDVPVVMDTVVELEKEQERQGREEAERRAEERKERRRVLARERYKRKKLGEWDVETDSGSDVADKRTGGDAIPYRLPPS